MFYYHDLISPFWYLVFEKYNWIQVLRNGLISSQSLYQKSEKKNSREVKGIIWDSDTCTML